MKTLTVGTLNLHFFDGSSVPEHQWSVRLPHVVNIVRQSGAWIVGFQESRFPYSGVSQAKMVAERLGPEWKVSNGGRYLSTIWRSDRFTLAETSQSFPLNPEFGSTQYPNRVARSALYTRFYDNWTTGKQVVFYNVHSATTDDTPPGATHSQVSYEAGETVSNRAIYDANRFPNSTAIIVGDTNSTGPFWNAVTGNGFIDALAHGVPVRNSPLNSLNQWDPNMVGKQNSLWIDRIFVSPETEVFDVGLVLKYDEGTSLPIKEPMYSDHFMVSANIGISS